MKSDKKLVVINIIELFIVCLGAGVYFEKGTRSIIPVVIALVWLAARKNLANYELTKSEKIAVCVLSFCFSVAVELVEAEAVRDRVDGIESLFDMTVLFLTLLMLFYTGIKFVWKYVRNLEPVSLGLNISNTKKAYWCFSLIIFGLLFLGLLLNWPGDISKDSVGIINQALYEDKMGSGFPFLIIWAMRACLCVASVFGAGETAGVALYCTIQILIISFVEGYILWSLALKGINRYFLYLSVIFFGIMPYNVHLCHTVWKDIPFSVCCVLFMFFVWQQSLDTKFQVKTKLYWIKNIAMVIAAVGMCIFRTNGYYAFIMSIPFMILLFWKNRKDMCLLIVVAFALAMMIQGPITDAVVNRNNEHYIDVQNAYADDEESATEAINSVSVENVKIDNKNMMGQYGSSGIQIVTIQQIAAVAMNRCDLSNEDREMIAEVIDVEKLRDIYNPGISDNTLKTLVGCSTKRYLQIWAKLGLKYPSTYIAAWKNMTYGYWYPDMAERWVYADEMADNAYGIERVEVLPHVIYKTKAGIDRLYKRIPFYGLLWSIGFIVWVTAFAIALTTVKRGWRRALCYMPIVGVWISLLIATPVYGEFRYLYPFFMALPITLVIPYVEENKQ